MSDRASGPNREQGAHRASVTGHGWTTQLADDDAHLAAGASPDLSRHPGPVAPNFFSCPSSSTPRSRNSVPSRRMTHACGIRAPDLTPEEFALEGISDEEWDAFHAAIAEV